VRRTIAVGLACNAMMAIEAAQATRSAACSQEALGIMLA